MIPPAIEAQVIGSLSAIALRRPEHPVVKALAARSLELVRSLPDVDQRLAMALFAASHGIWTGEFARLRDLGSELAAFIESPTSWRWASLGTWLGCVLWQEAEHDAAFVALDRALGAAREHGFPLWEAFIHIHIAYTALSAGDVDRAERAVAAGLSVAHPNQSLLIAHLRFGSAGTLLLRGRIREAIALAEEHLPVAERLGAPPGEATFRIQLGQMLMLDGRHADARRHLAWVLAFGRRMPSPILQFHALMALAWSHFDTSEDEQAVSLLREALAIGARQNYMNCHPWWIPRVMARLGERALAAGIETEYVRRLIGKRGLTPESPDAEGWPWSIEIHALGGFTLWRDGEAVGVQGKARHKVMDLLKAIVAFGGRGVSVTDLEEALWPEAEGDAAKGALDVTLHRLRKVLGRDDALPVSGGRVSLDPRRCRLDVWAFERAADRVAALPRGARGALDASAGEAAARELLRLYPGPLLRSEAEHAWLLPARERLANRFARSVRALAERLEQAGAREPARDLYRRAIELDPAAEEMYRRLMQSLVDDGMRAEALQVYGRCRAMLAATLGVAPSAETESIVRALGRPS